MIHARLATRYCAKRATPLPRPPPCHKKAQQIHGMPWPKAKPPIGEKATSQTSGSPPVFWKKWSAKGRLEMQQTWNFWFWISPQTAKHCHLPPSTWFQWGKSTNWNDFSPHHKAAANPEVFCYVVADAIHLGLPHVQWAPLPTLFAPSQATWGCLRWHAGSPYLEDDVLQTFHLI